MDKYLLITFWLTVLSFTMVVSQMVIAPFREFVRGSNLFLAPFAIFFLLCALLLFLTLSRDVSSEFRTFLLLTGGAGAGVFVSILLHNFIYGAAVHFLGEGVWDLFGGDEPFLFILGLIICPLGFLVGVLGTVTRLISPSP